MKIILEETYDLFDLILMTPEGLRGAGWPTMDHHIAFFLSFVARKVKGSFGDSVGIFFERDASPLGGDVICLA